jgi:hypothetical protein
VKDFLRVLFTPSCWIQNESYNAVWDFKLNALMKSHRFTNWDGYTARIGEIEVWVANHPYASFSYGGSRPSRATILKAHDKLIIDASSR